LSRFRRQKKNVTIASKAMTATGTTTAIATIPPVERPLLPVEGVDVLLLVMLDEEETDEVGLDVGPLVGTKVLVDVDVTVTTPPPLSLDEVGGGGVEDVGGGGGVVDVVGVVDVEVVVGVVLVDVEVVEVDGVVEVVVVVDEDVGVELDEVGG
jgi:hypothetical protein